MKFDFQQDNFSCGAHSVMNAARLLGISISLNKAKKLSNTKSYLDSAKLHLPPTNLIKFPVRSIRKFIEAVGTDEKGIKRGLKKLGFSCTEFYSDNPDKFLKFLDKQSGPVIMLVNFTLRSNDTGHWVVCGARSENNYEIIDSAPWTGKPRKYYPTKKLLNRFIWYDEDGEEYYELYCIGVRKN